MANLTSPINIQALEKLNSFADYQRANEEFMLKKQLQQAQMQKALMPEEITPYQRESLDLQKRRLDMAAGGIPTMDENGQIVMQPQKKLSATEQKAFEEQQQNLASIEASLGAFNRAKEYVDKPMYSGFGASAIADADALPVIGSFVDNEKAANTRAYQNLITQGQYQQLKTLFPGAISNAERDAIEKLGAVSTYTPEQRREIIANAEAGLMRLQSIAKNRARGIASGQQYQDAIKYNGQQANMPPAMGGWKIEALD